MSKQPDPSLDYTDEELTEEEIRRRHKAAVLARRKKKRREKRIKKILLIAGIILGVVLIALAAVYLYVRNLRKNTASFFETMPTTAAVAAATAAPVVTAAPESSLDPETKPAEAEPAETDASGYSAFEGGTENKTEYQLTDRIVNVLLIGVDYAEERLSEDWLSSGGSTAEHADVMIVLAINFDKQTVDMISLPRDTYAKIPGVQGIYKLNASLDCGGGLYKKDENGTPLRDEKGNFIVNEAGFQKVCESCSRMVAGLPINYYYAVTMPAVKGLVNAIGGVDFDLELEFEMNGRSYQKGQQHMDGQAVLDYLRVRKAASMTGATAEDVGDGARVNRQKDMLVAILNQLKKTISLTKITDIINTFDGQLFTNCTFEETAALAAYAYDMPTSNIHMWSMDGTWTSKRVARLNFCFTDQEKRVSIIKSVYGIDVPQDRECTMAYAYYFWNDLVAERYLATSHPLYKKGATESLKNAYRKVQNLRLACAETAANYLAGKSDYLFGAAENLEAANERLKAAAESAKSKSGGSTRLDFYSTLERYNEIQVDPS